MSKYEIKDAVTLKECMRIVAEIVAKYDKRNMYMIEDCPEHIKEAIEWIQEMVKQEV
jgi:hypothetical protein